jgi:hypothetical protein
MVTRFIVFLRGVGVSGRVAAPETPKTSVILSMTLVSLEMPVKVSAAAEHLRVLQ